MSFLQKRIDEQNKREAEERSAQDAAFRGFEVDDDEETQPQESVADPTQHPAGRSGGCPGGWLGRAGYGLRRAAQSAHHAQSRPTA